ncbi:profilin-like [Ylistrum balloti]|uniref:profilin-like n=1 Tax=Ylistrum balloti TaxID=509963 RepID=UPI002905EF8B|nr:profilin-like [Ylistrum balloti]
MSWDSYIDNLIGQTKDSAGSAHVDKACIIGLDGGAPWTTNAHTNAFNMAPDECAKIAKAFKSKDFSPFMSNGIHAEGTKYQFLKEEDGKTVMAKKKGEGALTCQASKTAIVIAHCKEGCQQGNANKGVAVIADYLESQGM